MKILITGGAGFVGSHLAEALVNLGHSVTIIDNYSTGRFENIKHLNLKISERIQNINNLDCGDEIDKYDTIFHLAAKPFSKAKEDWFSESHDIFQTNVSGTHNILRLANPNCHFIAASSASVYGEGQYLSESIPYNPKSAYGYTKMIMEQTIIHSSRKYTIVRPGTIIGPRGRCFPNRLIWTSIHNQECQLFNNGNIIRDLIDVRDVVNALIGIMDKNICGIYNLGANREISGFDLAKTFIPIAKHFNLKPTAEITSFVPSDFVKVSTLNSDKLYHALHWQPTIFL
jgi:UDP-glucose 4-epimerase